MLLCYMLIMFVIGDLTAAYLPEFFHLPSMISIIIVIAAVLYMTGEFKTFIKGINALLFKKYHISYADRNRAVKLFKLLIKVTVYICIANIAMGVVFILGTLEDPAALGPMVSVLLLTFFYAALLNLIFLLPAIHLLEKRKPADTVVVISEKEVINKLLEMCFKQGITPEEILEADEIKFDTKFDTKGN